MPRMASSQADPSQQRHRDPCIVRVPSSNARGGEFNFPTPVPVYSASIEATPGPVYSLSAEFKRQRRRIQFPDARTRVQCERRSDTGSRVQTRCRV